MGNGKMTASDLFEKFFTGPREIRSHEYKKGVMAALLFRLGESLSIPCEYAAGSVQADAYRAGIDEGNFIARNYLNKPRGEL